MGGITREKLGKEGSDHSEPKKELSGFYITEKYSVVEVLKKLRE